MKREIKNIRCNHRERGSTTFEAIMAIVILFLIVFSMLQIYHWCMSRQICQYSAFFTNKWVSLGYHDELALRAAKVAAIPSTIVPVSSRADKIDAPVPLSVPTKNMVITAASMATSMTTFFFIKPVVFRAKCVYCIYTSSFRQFPPGL